MAIINLSDQHTLMNTFMLELRDQSIQRDPMRFRRNLERVGEIMAYEISKTLEYQDREIQTPLGQCAVPVIADRIVLGTILRAGLPLHRGFLNYFDRSENVFISAFRDYSKGEDFDIRIEYIASPDLSGKTLILVDPMIATGDSLVQSYAALLGKGNPSKVHIATVIASADGVEKLKEKLDLDTIDLWCAAIDPTLNSKSYIVPGLGDAGDLAFGEKM